MWCIKIQRGLCTVSSNESVGTIPIACRLIKKSVVIFINEGVHFFHERGQNDIYQSKKFFGRSTNAGDNRSARMILL